MVSGANVPGISFDIRTREKGLAREGMVRAEIVEMLTCTCKEQRRVLVIARLNYYHHRVKAEYTTWYNKTVGKRIFLLVFFSSTSSEHYFIVVLILLLIKY